MKVETNSPTRESIQRTSRKMLSADDWAFQWNIDPNTARSMAYKGIPKVKNSESVNTTSSQCPLRTCIPPGKIEKKGVVMVAVPKKKKPRILMMQVTKAPIMDMAISPPIQINMNLKIHGIYSPCFAKSNWRHLRFGRHFLFLLLRLF